MYECICMTHWRGSGDGLWGKGKGLGRHFKLARQDRDAREVSTCCCCCCGYEHLHHCTATQCAPKTADIAGTHRFSQQFFLVYLVTRSFHCCTRTRWHAARSLRRTTSSDAGHAADLMLVQCVAAIKNTPATSKNVLRDGIQTRHSTIKHQDHMYELEW